ncbi:MAG: Gfo/Idh/MocA family oxidoreductase [Tagaea sp.]|nr:Gfo/Idh/MocA family oxidoreductase [Tagaea sp.]
MTLRVILFGAGMVAEHHLRAWAATPGAEIVGIVDPDPAKARARAATFGIARVWMDADAALAAGGFDAVDIATPVATHAALCRAAAARGFAILCQKPLCPTIAEAEALARDVTPRARLMVHENWRFRPEYREAKRVLESGALGPIRSVRLRALSSGLIADPRGVRPALVRQPFLAELEWLIVFELLVHHLDLLGWLFGPLTVERAHLSRRCPAVRGEDTAEVALRGASGVDIRLDGSFAEPGAPAHIEDILEVEGIGGRLIFRDRKLSFAGREMAFAFAESYAASYRGAIGEFVTALAAGRTFETGPEAHLRALRLVAAIYAAVPKPPATR